MTDVKHYLYLLMSIIFLISFLITLILLFYYKSILIDPKNCPKYDVKECNNCNNCNKCKSCNNINS